MENSADLAAPGESGVREFLDGPIEPFKQFSRKLPFWLSFPNHYTPAGLSVSRR
jgi:hypothetical protein